MPIYVDPRTCAMYNCRAAVRNLTLNWSDISLSSISRPEEAATWQNMVAIKSNILKRMDTAPIGVRVCCIKLLQRIVQVQTPGVISDPRVRKQLAPICLQTLERC